MLEKSDIKLYLEGVEVSSATAENDGNKLENDTTDIIRIIKNKEKGRMLF